MNLRVSSLLLTFAIVQISLFECDQAVADSAEAVIGRPFGVAKITVTLSKSDFGVPIDSHGFSLKESSGRTFYPSFSTKRVLPILQSLIGIDAVTPPQQLTIYFLFQGDAPLDITVYTPSQQRIRIAPVSRRPAAFNIMMKQWWRSYHTNIRDQDKVGNYPAVVETYLSAMLSKRLGMAVPPLSRGEMEDREALTPSQSLMLLMGTEEVRNVMMKSMLSNEVSAEPASQPVPAPIDWHPLLMPEPADDVVIEPMAMNVPVGCFYVRFGELNNYLWLNKLLEESGGDLSRLVSNRGVDLHLSKTIQDQLALKQTALAEVFGSAVVDDVALIGRDTFTREGAALGMLFKAKNNLLMANDITSNRSTVVQANKKAGATLVKVKINGTDVSFLSTPDNRIRSFYVQRGSYHLVSTSRSIIEMFLSIDQGRGSLGESREFKYARTLMPVDRKDTIFVYLSSSFFRGLYSPQYRIELRRRIHAVTEMELLKMAQAAALNEKLPEISVDQLIAHSFLPRSFGRRADQSVIRGDAGGYTDSVRGKLGNFMPIPDVPVDLVTASEAREYETLRFYHVTQWQQMDPVMVGINRFKLNDEGLERVAIDLRMAPFGKNKYGSFTKYLGPPLNTRVAPMPTDLANLNLVILGDHNMVHQYGVGIQDLPFPVGDLSKGGLLDTLRMLQVTPGYLTAWPKPGIIDKLPIIGNLVQPDIHGYSKILFGLWRREFNGFSTLSFDYNILANITPELHLVEEEEPAQVRLHVGDISDSHLTPLANGLAQSWAIKGSLGNARFFHAISEQLGVPRDQAREFAEDLMNLDLICSLDGKYELIQDPSGLLRWESSAWRQDNGDYQSNLMRWFRGLNARMNVGEGLFVAHAEIDMQREKPEPTLKFPSFNLFGTGKPKEKSKPKKADAEEVPKPKSPEGKQF
ncbi:MAG: hypothetical protein ACKVH8_00445 [Pirellulales bacterium]